MAQSTLALLPRQTFAQEKKHESAPSDCLIRKLFRRVFYAYADAAGRGWVVRA